MKHANGVNAKRDQDRRVRRTRAAIVEAFNGMVLQRPFESIQIGEIIDDAGVGRSTFYEHFRNKEEVLSQAATAVLGVLAGAVDVVPDPARVAGVLRHFHENRRITMNVLCGESGPLMQERLAALIAERLAGRSDFDGAGMEIPVPLAAAEIAGAQIALVRAWLASRAGCDAEVLAGSMCRTCGGIARLLVLNSIR